MIVVDKIIDMAISLVKERLASGATSKARAARAILDLHSALIDCHESYLDWRRANGSTLYGYEYDKWAKNVERLGNVYASLQEKLAISAPAVDNRLGVYVLDEVEKASPRIQNTLLRFLNVEPTEALENVEAFEDFDQAIAELRGFIRTQFKWEDLFA